MEEDPLLQRPPIKNEPLSLIVLVLRPPSDLETKLSAWLRVLEDRQREYELLLVLPPDHLPFAMDTTRLRRLDVPEMTLGTALRVALTEARLTLVGIVEGLDSYQPGDFHLLLDAIDAVDLVSAERTGPPGVRVPRLRWSTWLAIRFLFGLRLRDPGSGFKLLRRSILARMPVQSKGTFAYMEMLAKANFLGCLMAEVAVPWRPPTTPLPADPWTRQDCLAVLRNPDFGPPPPPPVTEVPPPAESIP